MIIRIFFNIVIFIVFFIVLALMDRSFNSYHSWSGNYDSYRILRVAVTCISVFLGYWVKIALDELHNKPKEKRTWAKTIKRGTSALRIMTIIGLSIVTSAILIRVNDESLGLMSIGFHSFAATWFFTSLPKYLLKATQGD